MLSHCDTAASLTSVGTLESVHFYRIDLLCKYKHKREKGGAGHKEQTYFICLFVSSEKDTQNQNNKNKTTEINLMIK